jgi:hypothetical protein
MLVEKIRREGEVLLADYLINLEELCESLSMEDCRSLVFGRCRT